MEFWFLATVASLCLEPEDNTMLDKVVFFVIFGQKCIFDASKHSNKPTDFT